MDIQEIDVFIDANGQVRLEVRGVPRPACLDATRSLEEALGGQIISREMTAEAGAPATSETEERQRHGA